MAVILASLIALGLTIVSVLVHYEAFRLVAHSARAASSADFPNRRRLLIVIFGALAAHTVEISIYGLAFWAIPVKTSLGAIIGMTDNTYVDYLYFSITNYTTLGIGDLHAIGALRLVAASEALTGLVLLSWTASFTYLSMENFWKPPR